MQLDNFFHVMRAQLGSYMLYTTARKSAHTWPSCLVFKVGKPSRACQPDKKSLSLRPVVVPRRVRSLYHLASKKPP